MPLFGKFDRAGKGERLTASGSRTAQPDVSRWRFRPNRHSRLPLSRFLALHGPPGGRITGFQAVSGHRRRSPGGCQTENRASSNPLRSRLAVVGGVQMPLRQSAVMSSVAWRPTECIEEAKTASKPWIR